MHLYTNNILIALWLRQICNNYIQIPEDIQPQA